MRPYHLIANAHVEVIIARVIWHFLLNSQLFLVVLICSLDLQEAIVKFIEGLGRGTRLNYAFLKDLDEHFEFFYEGKFTLMV